MGKKQDIRLSTSDGESDYKIDRTSQKILIQLYEQGPATASELRESVGVEQEQPIHYRYTHYLGPDASGALEIVDRRNNPGAIAPSPVYGLTTWGRDALEREYDLYAEPKSLREVAVQAQEAKKAATKALRRSEKYASNRYVINERSKENRKRITSVEHRVPLLIADAKSRFHEDEEISRNQLRQELDGDIRELWSEILRSSQQRQIERKREISKIHQRILELEDSIEQVQSELESKARRSWFR